MSNKPEHDMADDYDFSAGVRGKFQGSTEQARVLHIRQADGSVKVETLEPPIELDPEVRKYFPTSEAVNRALRGLIELIPDEAKPSSGNRG